MINFYREDLRKYGLEKKVIAFNRYLLNICYKLGIG